MQHPVIRAVIHEAIAALELTLVTDCAFPELHQHEELRFKVIMDAAKKLRRDKKDIQYDDIRWRAKKDPAFVQVVGEWVSNYKSIPSRFAELTKKPKAIDRLSHMRTKICNRALVHIAAFQLSVEDQCRDRVAALFKNNCFVYPGHWSKDAKGNVSNALLAFSFYLPVFPV